MDFGFSLFENGESTTKEYKVVPVVQEKVYDVIIIGGGPAALTAAVYCMRKGVDTAIIAKEIGGQVAETKGIENYMGYRYVEGLDLVKKFEEQVRQFEIAYQEWVSVTEIKDGPIKELIIDDGNVYKARSVIIATGKSWRKLGVPGEKELTGRGVAFCSTCDAPLFARKRVIVVGGGNSGVQAALELLKKSKHVTLVQNLEKLTADKVLVDKLLEYTNVEVLYNSAVTEIKGTNFVEKVQVQNILTKEEREIELEGVFVEIGLKPNTEFVENLIELNKSKEIVVDCACATNREGIFAAGDVTIVPFKQIIIAAGEGAKAAIAACEYVMRLKK